MLGGSVTGNGTDDGMGQDGKGREGGKGAAETFLVSHTANVFILGAIRSIFTFTCHDQRLTSEKH
jgi:hypothetical protein